VTFACCFGCVKKITISGERILEADVYCQCTLPDADVVSDYLLVGKKVMDRYNQTMSMCQEVLRFEADK
jgi:hypothetical protein